MSKLNVSTVAFETAWKNPRLDLENFERDVKTVLELFPETHIILFPEITFMGYIWDESNRDLAESVEGPVVTGVRQIAMENDVAVIVGMIEDRKNDKPYNSSVVVGRKGDVLSTYRKNHLFTESPEPDVYSPGEELSVFELEGWRCGQATCFDIRFPRLFEAYKKAGVECVFIGSKWVKGRNKPEILDFLTKARAHENQNFVVTVDSSGSDPNTTYHGISIVSNPYGEDIAERNGIYSNATLDRTEIEKLSKALPLDGSFKNEYQLSK